MRTHHIKREDAWKSLVSTIWKGIEFPMMNTFFNRRECSRIMALALKAGLQQSGIQYNTPRVLVHGPTQFQGLDFRIIFVTIN